MKKYIPGIAISIMLLIHFSCAPDQRGSEPDLIFIAVADWRYTTTEEYRTPEYFLGALQAIAEVGKGDFMLSPGDVDPLPASRELISQVLGSDYPWYPVIGNHELDSLVHVDYLRRLNAGGEALPNVVRKGPPGTEETTYSFDWNNCHFVVLNQYFDGESDVGADGNVVPELLDWLEEDLAATGKSHIFVIGHEPIVAIPDMDNWRLRHQGNSLDKYKNNTFRFHQLMLKYDVAAYICGHTHNTSIAKINGIWQIDVGHARGIEDLFPEFVFEGLNESLQESTSRGMDEDHAIRQYFEPRKYAVKKVLYYLDLTGGVHYKELADEPALEALSRFYFTVRQDPPALQEYSATFWGNFGLARSSFIRIIVADEDVKAEVYRNDARGGAYTLTYIENLD